MYSEKELRNLNRSQLIFEAKKNGIKISAKDNINGIINKFRLNNLIKNYLPEKLVTDENIRDILYGFLSDDENIGTILGFGNEELKQKLLQKYPNINLDLELASYHKESILNLELMRTEIKKLLGNEFVEKLPDIKFVSGYELDDFLNFYVFPYVGKQYKYILDDSDYWLVSYVNEYISITNNICEYNNHSFLNVKYNPILDHMDEVSKYKIDLSFLNHVWNQYDMFNPTKLSIQLADAIVKMKNVVEIYIVANQLRLIVSDIDSYLLPKGYTVNEQAISYFYQLIDNNKYQYGHINYENPNQDRNVKEYSYDMKDAINQKIFIIRYNWNQFPRSNIVINNL